jgi:phage shock protein C
MDEHGSIKRLRKSRQERMIDGVCGGIAEYAGVDPTLVRVAFLLLLLFKGFGALLYIAGMILMPSAPPRGDAANSSAPGRQQTNTRFWGILLVVVGIVWLVSNLGWLWWRDWWGVSWEILVPLVLILAGVGFLFGGRSYVTAATVEPSREEKEEAMDDQRGGPAREGPMRRLTRSMSEKKIFGVCGGIGMYLGVDPTVIRILFVIAIFATGGGVILVYLLMALLVPKESPPLPVTQ